MGFQRFDVLQFYSLDGSHPTRQNRTLRLLSGRHPLEQVSPPPFVRPPADAKDPFWEEHPGGSEGQAAQ